MNNAWILIWIITALSHYGIQNLPQEIGHRVPNSFFKQNEVHSDIHDILIGEISSVIEFTLENVYRSMKKIAINYPIPKQWHNSVGTLLNKNTGLSQKGYLMPE